MEVIVGAGNHVKRSGRGKGFERGEKTCYTHMATLASLSETKAGDTLRLSGYYAFCIQCIYTFIMGLKINNNIALYT